jgi:transposase-like protein
MDTSKTGSGRRRWTRKQRLRLLASFHESQLTQHDFATQHGVGLSTLSKWLRLERDAVPAEVKFQEVRLPAPTSRWPVEVVSPQGWIVRLQNGSDVQKLPELLRTLPC